MQTLRGVNGTGNLERGEREGKSQQVQGYCKHAWRKVEKKKRMTTHMHENNMGGQQRENGRQKNDGGGDAQRGGGEETGRAWRMPTRNT